MNASDLDFVVTEVCPGVRMIAVVRKDIFKSVPAEEAAALPVPTQEKVDAAIAQGREDRKKVARAWGIIK